ncbi:MAG: putative transcriptional regulator [Candidatus Tokpelaia sp. JSC188]|nr:MAG: putative transcriptional regulator [Candidatus Tokpelaia sp. JSC188]
MTIGKLYIGHKIRNLREQHKSTQARFAERIGISTSYLNQIENNQRSVSAAVLLALAEKFQVDISSFSSNEDGRLLSTLTDVLTDPVFKAGQPSFQEMRLIMQNAPKFAQALISCHQAYRRATEQLTTTDGRLGTGKISELLPYNEVQDFFCSMDNYIHKLDKIAEALAATINLAEDDSYSVLTKYLEQKHDVIVRRAIENNDLIYCYDPSSGVLLLNPYVSPPTRNFQIAVQLARLEVPEFIEEIITSACFKNNEAYELCRIGLYNYFAGALLMPYQIFLQTAKHLRHDIELLAVRFNVSLEQVCHRLSTLQRPGLKGIPVFFFRVDQAGNIIKRYGTAKLQFGRFNSSCPVWNVHQAFSVPGQIIRQLAETPDGTQYLCLATQIIKGKGGFQSERPRYALALGCEISNAQHFVYADDLDLFNRSSFTPIGISCHICPRAKCINRTMPPLKYRLIIDHDRRGVLPYALEND